MQLFLQDSSGNWKQSSADALAIKSRGLAAHYQKLHASRRHQSLHDFDDHLNDISKYALHWGCVLLRGGERGEVGIEQGTGRGVSMQAVG